MDSYTLPITLVVIIVIICLCAVYSKHKSKTIDIGKIEDSGKLDQRFYEPDEIYPELNNIYDDIDSIRDEIINNVGSVVEWKDWPEKDLYSDLDKSWKIVPFKAFDVTVDENCNKYPKLWKFIRSVPNVRVAILSKLGPGMKLTPHRGWGSHSNHVLRCHFGLVIPQEKQCYIAVADSDPNDKAQEYEKRYHSQGEWLVFDDSKYHYAENPTKYDRIVLIMDLDRPENIKKGTSKIKDTKELLEIVNSFRK